MRYPLDTYTITQGYNPPVHYGLDMAAPKGTPVLSPVTGTVISVGTDPNYIGGRYVIVREDSPNHYEYYTGHHSATQVSVGQHVTEGQLIAQVGQTGQATGPHVHFQIRKYGAGELMNPVDVYNQYNGEEDMKLTEDQVNKLSVLASFQESKANPGVLGNVGLNLNAALDNFLSYPTTVNFRNDALAYRAGGTSDPKVTVNGKEYVPKK